MNDGKVILLDALNKKLDSINNYDIKLLIYDNSNLLDVYKMLNQDINNFANISDNIVKKVCNFSVPKMKLSTKNNLKKIKTLLQGQKDYKLFVHLTDAYVASLDEFMLRFEKMLNSIIPGIVTMELDLGEVKNIIGCINGNKIISNTDYIKTIVKEYNKLDYDYDMVQVMIFINKHNLEILNATSPQYAKVDIKKVNYTKLDSKIIKILDELNIDLNLIPNYLLGEIRKTNIDNFCKVYKLIRKKEAEKGGINHLITKDNYLSKLLLLLYSTPETILKVIDTLKVNEKIDIKTLKVVLNSTISCFISNINDYFTPKFQDFKDNMKLLKKLGVNYNSLIVREPLFILNDTLTLATNIANIAEYNIQPKVLINKLYKTLTLNPDLIIENLEVLKEFNIDSTSLFSGTNAPFSILKISDLRNKMKEVIKENKLNVYQLNLENVNKYIVKKVLSNK